MKASIGESVGDYTRHEILSTMESESQKVFKENHPKLTPNQLIETMSRKGIKFNLMSKEEAKKRITENTYYFKVGVYRHNFIKDENGQYSNLDFAHLDDLAILDMRLRKILLNMSLDLEHSLKTLVNSIVTMDKLVCFARLLYTVLQRKSTQLCNLNLFFDYFDFDNAFFNRKLSPVKLRICA